MIITTYIDKSIGHRLPLHEGLCANLHGHNYRFTVAIEGNPEENGMVVDFSFIRSKLNAILDKFDHAMVMHFHDPLIPTIATKLVTLSVAPSAENFASLVFNLMRAEGFKMAWVEVRETETSLARTTQIDNTVKIMGFRA